MAVTKVDPNLQEKLEYLKNSYNSFKKSLESLEKTNEEVLANQKVQGELLKGLMDELKEVRRTQDDHVNMIHALRVAERERSDKEKLRVPGTPQSSPSILNREVLGEPTLDSTRESDSHLNSSSRRIHSFLEEFSVEGEKSKSAIMKAVPLPLFYGEHEKACNWLRSYEEAAALNFWSELELIRGVGACMKDEASTWYWYVYGPKIKGRGQTWQKFKLLFLETYVKEEDRHAIFLKLMNRVHKKNERLSTYFHSVLSLCMDFNPDMQENEIISYVLKGLEPALRNTIASSLYGRRTLEVLEHLIGINDGIAKKLESEVDSESTQKEETDEVKVYKRRDPSAIVCYNCMKTGHFMSNCPDVYDAARVKANQMQLKNQREAVVNSANVGRDVRGTSDIQGISNDRDQGSWRFTSGVLGTSDTQGVSNGAIEDEAVRSFREDLRM